MNQDREIRVRAWAVFKGNFRNNCNKIEDLRKHIQCGKIYHSNDKDDMKKSQLILAFMDTPINAYRDKSGQTHLETQHGCSLFYDLEFNGNVTARIKDYDNVSYKLKKYTSASKITDKEIQNHYQKFILVECNSNKLLNPSLFCRMRFHIYKNIQQKEWHEILVIVLKLIPGIRQLMK